MIWAQRLIEKKLFSCITNAKVYSKPTCTETQRRLDTEINLTNLTKNNSLWQHIKNCHDCRKVWIENFRVKESLQRVVKRESAPDSLKKKIQSMIHKEVVG